MNKNTKIAIGGTTFVLALSLTLTGCVGGNTPVSTPTATPSSTPAPSNTSAPIEIPDGHKVGDEIDKATAKDLNSGTGNIRGYKLSNGDYVVVDRDKKLPKEVVKDLEKTAEKPADKIAASDFNNEDDAFFSMYDYVDGKAAEFGARVVVVYPDSGYWGSIASGGATPASHSTGVKALASKKAMVKTMTDWAAARKAILIVAD